MTEKKIFWRVLNRDGTFNIARNGRKKIKGNDLYHSLLTISWPGFFTLFVFAYIYINALFALAYYACDVKDFSGFRNGPPLQRLMDCFFFSVQTLATIGYGHVSPVGIVPNLLVTVEAAFGMMGFALVTGLFFARFARPAARIVFSEKAIIGVRDGYNSLFFRVGNERLNQVVEAKVSAVVVKNIITREGEKFRNIFDLKLERKYSPLFAMTWTIIHRIDKESPLFGMDKEDFEEAEAEILISITGFDDSIAAPIHARSSYTLEDLEWNLRFKDIITRSDDGKIEVDLSSISEMEQGKRGAGT